LNHDLRVRLVFYPAERARRIEAASDRLNRIFIVALAAERVGEPLDAPYPWLAVRRELRSNFETRRRRPDACAADAREQREGRLLEQL
jgi:hypothetical protein